ncbi:MAG: nucleotidyltransferase family protein [Oscillospiraceae bacterium]|jgi:hypothetical protein|nr:nucleotidyltransferase family protein [Oscillospiraceae bacterium]
MTLNKVLSSLGYKELRVLFKQIENIPYIHMKGEVLSLQAYNLLGVRHIGDFDFLVPRINLKEIEMKLDQCGFVETNTSRVHKITMLSASQQVAPWIKPLPFTKTKSIEIDLNFDVFWGEYAGKRIDISEFVSGYIYMDIYGCKVKALTPLKSMIQLILHHYNDMNSLYLLSVTKSIKYSMFKDVYNLFKNNLDTITIESLYKLSEKYEIIPYVYYVFYHTGLLFADDDLKKYIAAFKTSAGEALLNFYGLHDHERRHWKVDFKTRLESDNLYNYIKDDLTEKDIEKIELNKRIFIPKEYEV